MDKLQSDAVIADTGLLGWTFRCIFNRYLTKGEDLLAFMDVKKDISCDICRIA